MAQDYNTKYILLKNGRIKKTQDLMEWALWWENFENRRIAQDKINVDKGVDEKGEPITDSIKVSTVFLGLDHGYGEGPPVLFETMIFGGALDEEQWRYHSLAAARAGHKKAVALVKSTLNIEKN